MRQLFSFVRRLLAVGLYVAAFAVAGVLLYEIVLLVNQRPEVTRIVQSAPPLPLPSPVPTATPAPTAVPRVDAAVELAEPTVSASAPSEYDEAAAAAFEAALNGEGDAVLPVDEGQKVAAWFPASFDGGARESLMANLDLLDEISPFWYTTDSTGQLYGPRNDELVRIAQENGILVLPSINNVSDSNVVIPILNDPYVRARHIQNIVDEVLARNYDGIDIDYEALPESVRSSFSAFIIELSDALHAEGKLLSVAVYAKDCDYCGLGSFQDYVVIGQHADRVRIMTYDYHWRGGGPGPVAPLYWVESVAEYARTVIEPRKVFIGVPFYGYDWPATGEARGLPWADIEDLIDDQKLTVNLMQRDSKGRVDESWFNYESDEGTRQVWFMTDDGLESKIELVQQLDLGGIAIWRMGYEKPEYWQIIRDEMARSPTVVQQELGPILPEH